MRNRFGPFYFLSFALLLSALPPPSWAQEEAEPCKNHYILRCPEGGVATVHWVPVETLRFTHGEGASVTALRDGRVLIAGGTGTVAEAEVYDPLTGHSMATALMTRPRSKHHAVLLADGRVLVVGGEGWSSSAEIFDPAAGTWTATGPMVVQRGVWFGRDMTATLLPDGRVLVTGGHDALGEGHRPTETYDPTTNAWSFAGDLREGRVGHTATLLGSGRVLIVGGVDTFDWNGFRGAVELFDPATNTWSAIGSSPTMYHHSATLLEDGRVLFSGGQGADFFVQGIPSGAWWPGASLSEAWLFSEGAALWESVQPLHEKRHMHVAAALPGGVLAAAGRFDSMPVIYGFRTVPVATAEWFDLASGKWNLARQVGMPPEFPANWALLHDGSMLVVARGGAARLYIPREYSPPKFER